MAYMNRLLLAQEKLQLPRSGLLHCTIAHDSWCAIYKGKQCNCHPEITFKRDGKLYSIDDDGNVAPQEPK